MRTTPGGMQCLREGADISVKHLERLCYNIYVTFSIVVYSFACEYIMHNNITSWVGTMQ